MEIKYIIRNTIALAVCLFGTVSTTSCQVDGPAEAITRFSRALEERNIRSLIPFVTNEPKYVTELSYKEYLRVFPQAIPEANKTRHDGVVVAGPAISIRRDEDLVAYVVPTDLFFGQGRTVKEVVSIRAKENEAMAQVRLPGTDPKTGEPLAAITYDILLYRDAGQWKIFRMIARNEGDEKYYQYGFYAKPGS